MEEIQKLKNLKLKPLFARGSSFFASRWQRTRHCTVSLARLVVRINNCVQAKMAERALTQRITSTVGGLIGDEKRLQAEIESSSVQLKLLAEAMAKEGKMERVAELEAMTRKVVETAHEMSLHQQALEAVRGSYQYTGTPTNFEELLQQQVAQLGAAQPCPENHHILVAFRQTIRVGCERDPPSILSVGVKTCLDCRHVYEKSAILENMTQSRNCPVSGCRQRLSRDRLASRREEADGDESEEEKFWGRGGGGRGGSDMEEEEDDDEGDGDSEEEEVLKLPMPSPPAGFVLDDEGEVVLAAPAERRTLTIHDPITNRSLDCVIRRAFSNSLNVPFFLLHPLDTPIMFFRISGRTGELQEVDDEEAERIIPAAAYALAKKSLHLTPTGFTLTLRGAICFTEDDVINLDTGEAC
ncbi:unnamed protein product [Closterium sp. NIES-53]